jgi:CRP-like cAMP-binding protein
MPFRNPSLTVSLRTDRPEQLASLENQVAEIACFERDQAIYGLPRPPSYCYRVISGAAREYTLNRNGRRRIIDFLLPGDYFGFGAGSDRHLAADAVGDRTLVACYPLRRVATLTGADPMLTTLLQEAAVQAITRLEARVLMLGRGTALEKVHGFLLEMEQRGACGGTDKLVLPMSRCDIADYLALSVETVSRSLSDLKQRGTIAFTGTRRLTILDHDALDDDVL